MLKQDAYGDNVTAEEDLMNTAEKKIEFYEGLLQLVRNEEFIELTAMVLIGMYQEIKNALSLTEVTIDFLRLVHKDMQDSNSQMKSVQKVATSAWKDLARHMRSPKVRFIVDTFIAESGWGDLQADRFVHRLNIRHLEGKSEGYAVVTLLVDDYQYFLETLEAGCEVLHYSE